MPMACSYTQAFGIPDTSKASILKAKGVVTMTRINDNNEPRLYPLKIFFGKDDS
jgi:hypothetical protein